LQGIGLLPAPPFDFLWVSAWQVFFANQVQPFLKQLQGLLREDGLLMMSYLGPDTAKEYRQIFPSEVFLGLDMHDIGDALAKTGFADPVMNMEYLTLTYENSQLLQNDLQALQVIPENLDAAMQKTLYDQFECLKEPSGWSLTLEIVYAHAWLGRKREPKVTTIQASEITLKNKK
jgi:malonyl-CoA O-methyltransferase